MVERAERPIPWDRVDRTNFSFDQMNSEIEELIHPPIISKPKKYPKKTAKKKK